MKKKLLVILFACALFALGTGKADAATLRFYDEDGGNEIGVMNNAFGTVTATVEQPTRGIDIFEGWQTDAQGITIDGNSITISRMVPWYQTVNIYATWTNVYTITYELDGGEASGNPETYTEYDEVSITDPTKDGYEFLGWIDENGENLGKGLVFEEGTTGNKTLTAAWQKNPEAEETKDESTPAKTTKKVKNPKTGDSVLFNIVLISTGLISLIGLTVLDKVAVKNN